MFRIRDLPRVKRVKTALGLNPGMLGGVGRPAMLGGVRRRAYVTYPVTPTKVFFPAGVYYARRIRRAFAPTPMVETTREGKILV